MTEKNKLAANSNEDVAQNYKMVAGDENIQTRYGVLKTSEIKDSSLQTIMERAHNSKKQQADNDNSDGDDIPPPFSVAKTPETAELDDTSYVAIDIEEVAKCTHISKKELELICANDSKMLAIPKDIKELNKFVIIQEGASKTAANLAKNNIIAPEARSYFLRKSQEYGYLWLKGEAQLGNEIRKIRGRQGTRSDLTADNDNTKKKKADLDEVLNDLRSKKEILAEDYNIGYTQARQLARLTEDLVEKELKYAVANNETLSRVHALSFLNQPAEQTDEEKAEADTTAIKSKVKEKFDFETAYSSASYEALKERKTVESIKYCSLFACVGSCEYYLAKHGFKCVLANEFEEKRAEYYRALYPDEDLKMIAGCFRENFDELVKEFKERKAQLLTAGIPCQTFCSMRGKNWRNDPRLTLIIDFIRFVKATNPKWIVLENAKEFFGFSLPLSENLDKHPIAKELQIVLNGRTMGDYLRDELTASGLEYDLNFSIEDACYYGTAQSRVRSILLASKTGTWNFPKAEEFAMPLWKPIGHLPSLEAGEDSGIPYHYAAFLDKDSETNVKVANVLAHTGTGRKSQDNDPKYQLSGFGFFGAKGARKFWDRPSNTLDSGTKNATGNRTIHPGRLRKDGTYSDARVLTLLEVFLVNGLDNYQVPKGFENDTSFIYEVMGEIFLPRMLERIILELPTDWE